MKKKKSESQPLPRVWEQGYRPIGTLNTKNPPKGGSGVPSK